MGRGEWYQTARGKGTERGLNRREPLPTPHSHFASRQGSPDTNRLRARYPAPVRADWVKKVEQRLIDRGWPPLGAESAADEVGELYYRGTDPWAVRYTEPQEPGVYGLYHVSRRVHDRAVYGSKSQLRASDVADVLNEMEESGSGERGVGPSSGI